MGGPVFLVFEYGVEGMEILRALCYDKAGH